MAALVITDQTFEDVPEEIDCPVEFKYIWEWFQELTTTRPPGAMGPGPITHQEITSWSDGMGISIMPIEREALRAIDRTFLVHAYSKDKRK